MKSERGRGRGLSRIFGKKMLATISAVINIQKKLVLTLHVLVSLNDP